MAPPHLTIQTPITLWTRALPNPVSKPTFGPCQPNPNPCRQTCGRKACGRQIRDRQVGKTRPRRFPQKGRPRLPGRRLGLHLPRLPRAAAAHPQVGRPADQRRARLLQHAVEAAQRHEAGGAADAPRRGVRQVGEDLPHRFLSRIQGAAAGHPRRSDPAVPADPRGGARLRHSLPGAGRLRGRRHHRDLRAARLRGQGRPPPSSRPTRT